MFEPIAGLPAGVIGSEAFDKVEATDDEDVLTPAIAWAARVG
jgi:hypothetical protein